VHRGCNRPESLLKDRDRENEVAAGQDQGIHRLLTCVRGVQKGRERGETRSAKRRKRMEVRHGNRSPAIYDFERGTLVIL